ncbi:DUF1214 domain-containing protein [Erythrobacter sp. Alg231-14]|uniref:DUF1214 domain-containing protein n=1 Tax=Erythrobacter sp. Alg231-14 TaxID=1922225 RepID=UPI000D55B318
MKRAIVYVLFGLFGLSLGVYTALAMSGLLPGDRRSTDGIEINGWTGDLAQGSSDASPYLRARIARHGLLALAKTEAIYFIRNTDRDGQPLTEECTYRVSGGPIPAGWWSITLYNEDNFLPDNDDEALSFDATQSGGGDWSAIISAASPAEDGNWISSRNAGKFDLTLRLYMPEDRALTDPEQAIPTPNIARLQCEGKAS